MIDESIPQMDMAISFIEAKVSRRKLGSRRASSNPPSDRLVSAGHYGYVYLCHMTITHVWPSRGTRALVSLACDCVDYAGILKQQIDPRSAASVRSSTFSLYKYLGPGIASPQEPVIYNFNQHDRLTQVSSTVTEIE